MTSEVDIVNRALQIIGTRTTIASLSEQSNEAIQANLCVEPLRDVLLRMAPWNCATNYANLTLISATPGTPENQGLQGSGQQWQRGLPPPPWAYEYQYPVDCLRPLYVIPQFSTGFASGIPITTAVTGGAPAFWLGPPQKFKVAIDQFYMISGASVAFGGTGYAVGDFITLASNPVENNLPPGAPGVLQVTGVSATNVTTVVVVSQLAGSTIPISGSYYNIPISPVGQGSSTGLGSGATFNIVVMGGAIPSKHDQRVILTNQEFATLAYVRQVVDPNVMDPQFLDAWTAVVAARLAIQLSGDKQIANMSIAQANNFIIEARKTDGNEGLTINDVTPDFIRTRGIYYPTWEISPNIQFDWGPMFASY